MYWTTEYTNRWTRTDDGEVIYDCRDTGDYIITYRTRNDGEKSYNVQYICIDIDELVKAVNRINQINQ